MTRRAPGFRQFSFGKVAAEDESVSDPRLLLEGFLDVHGAAAQILSDHPFLVMGYKGSGKSAIGQHLRLTAEDRPDLFVQTIYLADFPYRRFAEITGSTDDPATRYPITWTWLILLYLLSSFNADQGSASRSDNLFTGTVEALQNAGLLPADRVPVLVQLSTKHTLRIPVANVLEYSMERGRMSKDLAKDFPLLVESLRDVVCKFDSQSEHLLVLDGLDDLLITTSEQLTALAGLVTAVWRLNNALRDSGTPAKVALVCRSDIFDRLPDPNTNKIRQDASVILDWFEDPRDPRESSLLRLVNLKARVGAPSYSGDLFEDYFPDKIRGKLSSKFLLEQTRHTPRDLLRLLHYIQLVGPERGRIPQDKVLSGVRSYSINYFLAEIRNELAGFLPTDDIDAGMATLSLLRGKQFAYADFVKAADSSGLDPTRAFTFLTQMFESSAIGMMDAVGKGNFFTFKYRNRESRLIRGRDIRVHPGLHPALNLTGGR